MNNIVFPHGKLSMTISDIITLIYTSDCQESYIGTTDIVIKEPITITNSLITIFSDHITLNLIKMNKIIVLLKVDNVDLIHNLAFQVATLNNDVKKISEVINRCVRIQLSQSMAAIIGTEILELCFTDKKLPSFSTVTKTVIYSDSNYYIDFYEDALLLECKTLSIDCQDISSNVELLFNWKNLPKSINTIVLSSEKSIECFTSHLTNITNDIINLRINNCILTEKTLEKIATKWPNILFSYNSMTFKFNVLY